MPQIEDKYKIDLGALLEANDGYRCLPALKDGDDLWWRYIADDDDGGLCMLTHPGPVFYGGSSELEERLDSLVDEYNLFPAIFDDMTAEIVGVSDEGYYVLRMRASSGPLYVEDGIELLDFMLDDEELEACAY